jgi:hypothetical protein
MRFVLAANTFHSIKLILKAGTSASVKIRYKLRKNTQVIIEFS